MQATVTLKVKLLVRNEDLAAIESRQAAYVAALNSTSDIAFENQVSNAVTLHHLTYRAIRKLTGLLANLVCSARAIVAEAYKRELNRHHVVSKPSAVRYDERTLKLDPEQEFATFSTLTGRIRAGLVFGDYHRQYLDGSWTIAKRATLIKRRGTGYLCLVADKQIEDAEGKEVLGLDAGINRVAAISTGKVFKSGRIKQIRKPRFKQRRSPQAGHNRSRGQRRLLQRLATREHRAVEWLLWNGANQIVSKAIRINACVIAAEDLKHIRDRIRVTKKQRLIQHGWPFASLHAKLQHLASKQGIRVFEVDARNTSRTCNRCGHGEKANRQSQSDFCCVSCGHRLNADYHASLNIKARGVASLCGAVTHRRMPVPIQGKESRLL